MLLTSPTPPNHIVRAARSGCMALSIGIPDHHVLLTGREFEGIRSLACLHEPRWESTLVTRQWPHGGDLGDWRSRTTELSSMRTSLTMTAAKTSSGTGRMHNGASQHSRVETAFASRRRTSTAVRGAGHLRAGGGTSTHVSKANTTAFTLPGHQDCGDRHFVGARRHACEESCSSPRP